MEIRLFDPTGLRPVDYKATYPEMKRTKEFESIPGIELIFIWYFANATSPLVDITDKHKKVDEAIRRSGYSPGPDEHEKLLKLQFPPHIEAAIEKMSSYLPGARYFGWRALKNIFDQYQDIASRGPESFKKKVGSEENEAGDMVPIMEIDYNAYTNTSTKISTAMPGLISSMEEGFGISITGVVSDDEEEGNSQLREWNLNRRKS